MLKKMKYANWREICKEMGWKNTGGCYKDARMKYFESLCSYHKDGFKFIIDEIYDNPKPLVDGRVGYSVERLIEYGNLKIDNIFYKSTGVYKISLGNKIYIGSTIVGFRDRFLGHYYGQDESMQHTYELIQNGGVFEILENMTGEREEVIRRRENEYIEEYQKNDSWEVINNYSGWGGTRFRNIKILSSNYDKAMNILNEHGLI